MRKISILIVFVGIQVLSLSGVLWGTVVLPELTIETEKKVKELCKDAYLLQKAKHKEEAVKKYEEVLINYPTTVFLHRIHRNILMWCLEGIQPTPDAEKIISSGEIKLLNKNDRTKLERSGLEKMMSRYDEIISQEPPDSNKAMVAKLMKAYIYLTGTYSGYQPPEKVNINKSINIFQEIINTNKPVWVLNGLIGLAKAKGLEAAHGPSAVTPTCEAQSRVLQEIIDKFPNSKHAALAQYYKALLYKNYNYKNENMKKIAIEEAKKILDYPDFELDGFETGVKSRSSHKVARSFIEFIEREKGEK